MMEKKKLYRVLGIALCGIDYSSSGVTADCPPRMGSLASVSIYAQYTLCKEGYIYDLLIELTRTIPDDSNEAAGA